MLKLFPLLFLFLLNPGKESFTMPYKIIAISDGDTFTVLQNNKPQKIRIDAIDAPEKGMSYGKNARQYLSSLCFGKYVTLHVKTTDRYGRWVARVKLKDGRDISAEMIKAGMAWHYKKYSKDPILSKLEIDARTQRIGLWHDKNPMAPWEVRKLRRKKI